MATLTNVAKNAASLAGVAKNRFISAGGGTVFYGFLFLFTIATAASGPTLTNVVKNSANLTNIAKS